MLRRRPVKRKFPGEFLPLAQLPRTDFLPAGKWYLVQVAATSLLLRFLPPVIDRGLILSCNPVPLTCYG